MKNEGASSPVERALWFIENRLGGQISLESIAKSVGVTDHHLVFRLSNNYTYSYAAFSRRFFGFVHPGEISSSR